MKEKVAAIISFTLGLGWVILSLYIIVFGDLYNTKDYLGIYSIMTLSVSTVLYVAWTKFGKNEISELEKLDYENHLLQRRIEQKELKKKLED